MPSWRSFARLRGLWMTNGMTPPPSCVPQRMKTSNPSIFAAVIALAAFALQAQPAATPERQNPLYSASPLPFQAPPFNVIKDTDYQPAIEEGMKRQLVEIDAIANNPAPPTLANTIEAMERSGALLTRAAKIFFNLTQSNTNDAYQKIEA